MSVSPTARSSVIKPLIGIPASVRYIEHDMAFHGNGYQYHEAVNGYMDANVFTIPSLENTDNAVELLDHVDGVLLTGSFSNIHPEWYQEDRVVDGQLFDRLRDENSFRLIREAISRGIPMFGICRGSQEFNVAFGGSLIQELHRTNGCFDHRSDDSLPLEEHFLPAHEIDICPGGVLERLGFGRRVMVNSSHMQGIGRLADGLMVEAYADDGTIEAVSVADSPGWNLAVQFHPEWYIDETPFYAALFDDFRQAVQKFQERKG